MKHNVTIRIRKTEDLYTLLSLLNLHYQQLEKMHAQARKDTRKAQLPKLAESTRKHHANLTRALHRWHSYKQDVETVYKQVRQAEKDRR